MTASHSLNNNNFREILLAFMLNNQLKARAIARVIDCSEATLTRLLEGKTYPSDEMLKQVGIMIAIGYEKYKKLSKAAKEKISESIGAVGGGVLGFGSITAAISASGAIVGLSAAGITSGLAAIGALVSGGMVAGILISAAIPIAIGGIGVGIVKLIKGVINEVKLNNDTIVTYWEKEKY